MEEYTPEVREMLVQILLAIMCTCIRLPACDLSHYKERIEELLDRALEGGHHPAVVAQAFVRVSLRHQVDWTTVMRGPRGLYTKDALDELEEIIRGERQPDITTPVTGSSDDDPVGDRLT